MLFGATVFGYIVGIVGVCFSILTESLMRHQGRMSDIVTYLQRHKARARVRVRSSVYALCYVLTVLCELLRLGASR